MIKDCFCILAGGGVRGTAYIGAIKALQEMDIKISGMAGSSAGAIFSSLYTVGYSCDEIKDLINEVSYQSFTDLYIPMGKDFGFFKGDGVYYWLREKIGKKFHGEGWNESFPPVTFKDLDKELLVIASDVSYTKFKEYNKVKTPDVEVAHAVRASISVPGFFKPVWEHDRCLVDGDVISNFPLWKVESDMLSYTNLKILEFRLESSEKPRTIDNVLDYFNAIIDTNYSIASDLLCQDFGKNDQFEIIKIDTGKIKILDFGISNEQKQELIQNGYNSVKKYFNYDLIDKQRKVSQIYEKINQNLKTLRKNINSNKIPESFINLGALSICFAENKGFVHKFIYREFIDLQTQFQNNLFSVKYLNIQLLRNKKDIVLKIDKILAEIKNLWK